MFTKMDNILTYFLKETSREFHVRRLAKLEKKSPTTISKILNIYAKEGILKQSSRLNHIFYKANMENQKLRDLKIYYNLKLIRNSGLTVFLEKELNHPEAIVLFGSFRKGDDIEKSDIDIVVISLVKKEINLTEFEKKLRHSLQLFILLPKDIESLKKSNPELLNNIANGIVLYGFLELFR
ncbi:MAG: nucleotidyltransferase domain-containing protein [Nanoarchaeota archaeon]